MTETEQYFLDTNFVVSLLDERDSNHSMAKELFQKYSMVDKEVFLSDAVVNESMTVLARRSENKKLAVSYKQLEERFRSTLENKAVLCLYEILYGENFGRIRKLMLGSNGHLNFHDCLIAIFLKEVPKVKLVSFDLDFDHVPWITRIH